MLNEEVTPNLHILFQKIEEKAMHLNSFYEASITWKPNLDKESTKKKKREREKRKLQTNISHEH